MTHYVSVPIIFGEELEQGHDHGFDPIRRLSSKHDLSGFSLSGLSADHAHHKYTASYSKWEAKGHCVYKSLDGKLFAWRYQDNSWHCSSSSGADIGKAPCQLYVKSPAVSPDGIGVDCEW